MANLFGLKKPNVNLRKNVFDLSQKTLLSMSAGQLLPVFTRECNPGEKFELNLSALTRTMPLNTAAFVRCRQYFHFFFVPYRQLWNGWDNFINGVDYKTSALQKDKKYKEFIPGLKIGEYIKKMVEDNTFIGLSIKDSDFSVDVNKYINDDEEGKDLDPYWKLISDNYFEDKEFLKLNNVDDYRRKCLDELGYRYVDGVSRLFDMLEYGFKYKGISTLSDYVDSQIDFTKFNAEWIRSNMDFTQDIKVNPFRFLAYQKIYNDFYKRDDYELTDPGAWNIDDLADTDNLHSLPVERLLSMTRLRYRWLPKDYFTGVVPTELYNTTSLSSLGTNYGSGDDPMTITNRTVQIDNSGEAVSTRGIRFAFALEKLMRLSRRAGGYDYINQISAHYGFNVPEGRGDKVNFIGGFSNNIDISEVVTTSSFAGEVGGQTFGNGIGQIHGRGVGVVNNNKPLHFTAPEHGLIMCIASVVPDLDYSAEGINKFNTKLGRGDYFHPELQDLGLQALFGYELYNDLNPNPLGKDRKSNALLGYIPAYSEYKTSYDTLHGEFRNGRSMSAWSAGQLLDYDSRGLVRSTLKINPSCLDRLFSIGYNGRESTDQFMVSAQLMCKAIRPMSVTGQGF